MVYEGPLNSPTCWPVTTATAPGLLNRSNEAPGAFWMRSASISAARRPSGKSISCAAD
jgi:hypothetical protein